VLNRILNKGSDDVLLMEFLLKGRLGSIVRNEVAKRLSLNTKPKNNWRDVMPLFMDVTMETLYPCTNIGLTS